MVWAVAVRVRVEMALVVAVTEWAAKASSVAAVTQEASVGAASSEETNYTNTARSRFDKPNCIRPERCRPAGRYPSMACNQE